jgi:hypothetical protein
VESFDTCFLNLLQLSTKLNVKSELKIKVSEATDKLKEALTRVNEMVELLLKVKEPIDGSQLIHMIFFLDRRSKYRSQIERSTHNVNL